MDTMFRPQGDRSRTQDRLRVVTAGDERIGDRIREALSSADVYVEQRRASALDRFEATEIDCVIAQADLRDASGSELLREVRSRDPGVARVLVGESVAETPADAAFVPSKPQADLPARVARRVERETERRAIERERDEFEDRLEKLVENSPEPIAVVDDDCRIVFANEAVERVLGYEPGAVIGEPARRFIDEPAHGRLESTVEELTGDRTVGRSYVELPGKRADGGEVPLAMSFKEVVRDGSRYFSVIARDVSERTRLEDRLEAERRKTRELHEVAVMLENCETVKEVCELTIETAEELLEFDLCAVDTIEDGKLVPQAVSRGVPSDGYYITISPSADDNLAARAYRRDESLRTDDLREADVSPAASGYRSALSVPIGRIGVLQAVSEEEGAFDESDRELAELLAAHVAQSLQRIDSEQALEAERDRFAALFENTRDAVVYYEMNDGEPMFQAVNEVFEEVFGYESERVRGESVVDVIVPDDRTEEAERHLQQMRRGDHIDAEVQRETASGPRDFLVRTAETPSDAPDGYIVYTDITDRKRLERNLERANRKFEELHHVAVRLEGLDDVAEIYEQTVRAAEEILEFDICGVATAEDGRLVPRATTSEFDDDYETLGATEGIAGRTYQQNESYVVEDVTESEAATPINETHRSILSVPFGDEGVLQAASRSVDAFDREDAKLAELLVAHASEAVQRVQSERALREERDRFAALFENIPEPTVDYGIRDEEPVVRSVNEAFEDVFGYDADEAVGRSIDDLIVPCSRSAEAERLNDRIRTGDRVDAEVRRNAADGVRDFLLRNAEVPGRPGNYVIYTDITERKEREEMLDALHAATRELMAAENEGDICQTAIETAREVLDVPHSTIFRWNEGEALLEPYLFPQESVEEIGDTTVFSPGEGIVGHVYESGESEYLENAWDDPRAHEDGSQGVRAFGAFPLGEWGVLTIASTEVGAFDDYELDLVRVLAANTEVALNRAAREAELTRQRSRLAELDRINEVIRDIDQLLVRASTREQIEEAVTERLADSDHYMFAWTGKTTSRGKRVEPTAAAGIEDGYFEESGVSFDDAEGGERKPAAKAARTGEVHVVQDISDAEVVGPWREPALDRGYRSVAAIPVRYRETVYGVLVLYAERADSFSERELTVLAELGETIGHAINAAENKKALVSDGVVEVEFEIHDGDGFFSRVAREEAATFSLEGLTMTTDGSFVYFMTVEELDPDRVLELADVDADVSQARLVHEHEDGNLFEFVYTGPSPMPNLAEHGGTLRVAEFSEDGGRSVVELPRSVDVRTVVESIRSALPGTEVVAHRERQRPEQTVQELSATLAEDLTERQRSALEAAYYAGFFEWPRESNGEEVSESLGVSPPTFHQHLRVGERKLLSAFLDE